MLPKTGIYDALEPKLNAGEVELLDILELQEQLLTLVVRNGRIDHQPGDHDDYANATAGALWLVSGQGNTAVIAEPIVVVAAYNRFEAIGGLTYSRFPSDMVKDNFMELNSMQTSDLSVNKRKTRQPPEAVIVEATFERAVDPLPKKVQAATVRPTAQKVIDPQPEEVIAELEGNLSAARARQTAITAERKAISLAAHMGSPKDRTRLDQLNQRLHQARVNKAMGPS